MQKEAHMGKIQILNDHIANQIAAGEVVERPASVVKELVENSLDAGSSRIDIHVEEGGLQLIRITDNGSGMDSEDAQTAFERHATSKIKESRELFQIQSLGFRGEALPSIAAVSRLECTTSTDKHGNGSQIVIEGGKIISAKPAAANQGTDIQVKNLFYNTPARLKYMKTLQTELGHISDYIYRMALAAPDVAFTFRHQGKVLLQTLGNGDTLQTAAAIYGVQAAKKLIAVDGSSLDYQINGLISLPEWTRANRLGMTFIVNGRYIRNYMMVKAVMDAYHTLLPLNRYPLTILQIKMDPRLIDVNVHPSKLEVRFSKEKELYDTLRNTVAEALQQKKLIPQGKSDNTRQQPYIQEQLEWRQPRQPGSGQQDSRGPTTYNVNRATAFPAREKSASGTVGDWLGTASRNQQQSMPQADPQKEIKQVATDEPVQEKTAGQQSFPVMYPIGQMKGTYILAQNEDGFYMIDQHAAHERIHYEKLYAQFGHPAQASQELLVPITMDLPPAEAEILEKRLPLLEQAGVYLQRFGGNTFKVSAYPHWLPDGSEKSIIEEMVEWILSEKQLDIAKLREKASILCSCKASIKANQSLGLAEMEALLQTLSDCRQPYTCPHGRPIIVSFSNYELEKMFKRVM